MTAMISSDDRILYCDIETHSSADLAKVGVFKYVEAPDFEILLMSYAWGDEPVRVWDFAKDGTPPWLIEALTDPKVTKVAHNCQFERTCFNRYLNLYTPPEQWMDTMHLAAMNGLPMSLEAAGAALQLEQQKLTTGEALIRYFCRPCRPTKSNGGRRRNLPEHAPEKWEDFKTYCQRDTETERAIYRRLARTKVPKSERRIECLDARINERGVAIDPVLVQSAIEMDGAAKGVYLDEMRTLTGLANPNSVPQLKTWLAAAGIEADGLDKRTVAELKGQATDPTTRRVLTLRQMLGKSSTSKYAAMRAAACADKRVRGTLQYYGAGRTGRWAGRIIQPQNLPQNHLNDIEIVREIARGGDLEGLGLVFDSVPDVLSQLIRTAIVAKEGHTFLVADYHAIEAVCIAYLAGEKWRLDVFAGDGKIYEASYAQAFGVPKESVKKGSPERQQGKVMELGLGYGMGASKFVDYAAQYKVHIQPKDAEDLVKRWRAASPNIPEFWRAAERAAKSAIRSPGKLFKLPNGCAYGRDRDALRLILPSGRRLSYWGAHLDESAGSIRFMGQNQTTRKWTRMETWGGRLVENIVQAFARDILAEAMLRLEDAGFRICFSIHDELVVEEPIGGRSWEEMAAIMAQPVTWAPGLDRYLSADGYATPFYKKE